MKLEKPDQLAAVTSVVAASFVFIALALTQWVAELNMLWGETFLVSLVAFISGFVVFRFAVNQFIYKKIKLIYKTIHDQRTRTKGEKEYDSLSDVDRQVNEWADSQRKEIADLQVREKFRREFIGNISHELKTPIFNIQGYILTLLDGGLDDPTINRDYLIRANNSVERMIRIVQDLDVISRIEAGILEMMFRKVNLSDLCLDIFETMEMKAQKKNIKLIFEPNSEKPVYVMADEDRVRQVLVNLMVNAIKYSKEGGGEVKVSFHDMDKNLLVEVKDNGIGISPEDRPRLFERFYRVDKSRSRDSGGSGLGLAIVKHIIEAHKQSITVRSTVGVGSTFSFTLQKA
jgi:two-component system, OmpR family, phosphate regulon sensor histidine kinase PhoR